MLWSRRFTEKSNSGKERRVQASQVLPIYRLIIDIILHDESQKNCHDVRLKLRLEGEMKMCSRPFSADFHDIAWIITSISFILLFCVNSREGWIAHLDRTFEHKSRSIMSIVSCNLLTPSMLWQLCRWLFY